MKARSHHFAAHPSEGASALVSAVCRGLNRAIAPVGTVFLIVGIIAVATGLLRMADYAFAAGLLLHLVAWFDNWWKPARKR